MKIEKTVNGNIRILDADNNILYQFKSEFVYPSPTDTDFVLFAKHYQDKNALPVHVQSVIEVQGVAFNGTRNDLIVALDSLSASSTILLDDYIDIDVEGEYQSMINWSNKLDVLLIKTTSTATGATRRFYQETVADLAAYNALWASALAGNITFVNPISL